MVNSIPKVPALRRQRQEDYRVQDQVYIVRHYLKKKKKYN